MIRPNSKDKRFLFLFVHGLGQGSWCWRHVRSILERANHSVITPDLPSKSNITTDLAQIEFGDDIRYIVDHAKAIKLPIVLVGHLTGNLVISQAAEILGSKKIHQLIYIDGVIPNKQNSKTFSSINKLHYIARYWQNECKTDHFIFSGDKFSVKMDNDYVKKIYRGCSKKDIQLAIKKQLWQATNPLLSTLNFSTQHLSLIKSNWISCTHDTSSSKNLHCLRSGLAPFFEIPEKLVDLILAII